MDAGVELVQAPAGRPPPGSPVRCAEVAPCSRSPSRVPSPSPSTASWGSINPVVVTGPRPSERRRGDRRRAGRLGGHGDAGQFCTKPGLVFAPAGSGFGGAVHDELGGAAAHPLLTTGMTRGVRAPRRDLSARGDVTVVRAGGDAAGRSDRRLGERGRVPRRPRRAHRRALRPGHRDSVVRVGRRAAVGVLARAAEPSLTATIRRGAETRTSPTSPRSSLRGAGRLVFGGWPTGVAIGWAQHHGGAWPSTTGRMHTSVGASSLRRLLTPSPTRTPRRPCCRPHSSTRTRCASRVGRTVGLVLATGS